MQVDGLNVVGEATIELWYYIVLEAFGLTVNKSLLTLVDFSLLCIGEVNTFVTSFV